LEGQLYAPAHINIMFFDVHAADKNEMRLPMRKRIKKAGSLRLFYHLRMALKNAISP